MLWSNIVTIIQNIQNDTINLESGVANPVPGSGALLTLDPGWVKNQDPDPG